jgi:uncharacterized membrane protein YfcA
MEFFDLSIMDIVVRLVLGLLIGFCIGLTGVGGGVLVLPALTVILRIDPIIAVGTTTLYAFLTKITATLHHFKLKTIDWGTSFRFLAGAVPANIITALWVSRQGTNDAFKDSLRTFIVCVVFFSVGMMIFNIISQTRSSVEAKERSLADRINGHRILRNGLSILMGIICGGLIGATAVGGGVLIVPMLIILFGLPASRTVGSAIFIAFILTLSTSVIYGTRGEQDTVTAVIMSLGSLAGVFYGSKLSVRLPETLLRIIVVALVLAAAVMMLFGQGGH